MRMHKNISRTERMIVLLSGAILLYRGLFGKQYKTNAILAGGALLARGVSGYCPVYDTLHLNHARPVDEVRVRTQLALNKTPAEVYTRWRMLEQIPQFMTHVESVEVLDAKHSEWKIKMPGGLPSLTYIAEITKDDPNEQLSWSSLPGSSIENAGTVKFKPMGEWGTEIQVEITYRAPAGFIGASVGKLLNPFFARMIEEDIQSFRTEMEAIPIGI